MEGRLLGAPVQLQGLPGRAGTAAGSVLRFSSALSSERAVPLPEGPRVFVGAGADLASAEAEGLDVVAAVLPESSLDLPQGNPRPIPAVLGLDSDLFRTGELVAIDGASGQVELAGVDPVRVVTVFLSRADGRVLLLRRSEQVGTFRGRWAAVSGFLEDATPLEQAKREVREEVGLDLGAQPPARAGRVVYARDGPRVFEVHPFRFDVGPFEVRIDWEHTEFEWVEPDELRRRATVPKLWEVWRAVAP